MELVRIEKRAPRALKAAVNMYTSTVALGTPFPPGTDTCAQDDFFGHVARHWSETVNNESQEHIYCKIGRNHAVYPL